LETVQKRCGTVLVSDGGGQMDAQAKIPVDWGRQMRRVLAVIDDQVRSRRKHECVSAFISGAKLGTYWGIRTDIGHYALPDALPCAHDRTLALAEVATRLQAVDDALQMRLINWGYAVCDAGLRKHVDPALTPPTGFPYPGGV
jgi:NTE family protein